MTTIRPSVFPQQPPAGGQRDDAARLNAQRAFFAAAMGQTQPPAAPAAPTAESPHQVNRVSQAASAEAPQRILRPGSILDIRV